MKTRGLSLQQRNDDWSFMVGLLNSIALSSSVPQVESINQLHLWCFLELNLSDVVGLAVRLPWHDGADPAELANSTPSVDVGENIAVRCRDSALAKGFQLPSAT